MKRLFLFLFLILFIGCYPVSIVSPAGKKTILLSETDQTTFKTSKRVWYVLWGLVPITDNSTADIISKYNLENVKVTTHFEIVDYLISAVLGSFSIQTKTVVVEGNQK
ncbi:MAG: hypothetical protein ABIK99_04780 [candidate division WOR-3 bacterium]